MAARMPWHRPQPVAPVAGPSPQRAALEDERHRLAEQVAESTWDLGGLVYEMAVRDHFRVDILARRAAALQQLDARLSEVERLAADHAGIAGNCRFCGAPHGRSAEYCWSCGERIMVRHALTIEGGVRTVPAPAQQPPDLRYEDAAGRPRQDPFEGRGDGGERGEPSRVDEPTRVHDAVDPGDAPER